MVFHGNRHTHLQLLQLCGHSELEEERGTSSDTRLSLVSGTLQLCGSSARILGKGLWNRPSHTVSQVDWNEAALNWNWLKRGGGRFWEKQMWKIFHIWTSLLKRLGHIYCNNQNFKKNLNFYITFEFSRKFNTFLFPFIISVNLWCWKSNWTHHYLTDVKTEVHQYHTDNILQKWD